METKRTYTESAREIPIRDNVDILVVGGGPSGIMTGAPLRTAISIILQIFAA